MTFLRKKMAKLLAGKFYDPATQASVSTSALQAMTAIDTTNLRLTFTAPASGKVVVCIGCYCTGTTQFGRYLFGILDGATVRLRLGFSNYSEGGDFPDRHIDLEGLITGLTPGNSYTFDAALGVEDVSGLIPIYGGPNDDIGGSYGGFRYEIWEVPA